MWIGAAALPRVAVAQGETPQPRVGLTVEGDTLILSINENEGLPIKEFIKMAQTVTGRNFTFSEQELNSVPDPKITFVGPMRIKKDDFFSFFVTMLYIKNFAVIIRGREGMEIIEIVNQTGTKRVELSTSARYVAPEEIPQYQNQTGVSIMSLVPVEHLNPTAAVNSLRPFFVGAGGGSANPLNFTQVGNAKAVLIQGFGPQVYSAYQILKLGDVPFDQVALQTRVVSLEHSTAEELEPILTDILNDRNRPRAAPQGQPDAAAAAQTQLKIVANPSQNKLILSGSQEQIVEAMDLVARLDVPIELTQGDQHVIPLKNVTAEELRTTLREFINEDLQAEQQTGGAAAGATQARRPRKTVVVAHKESNSLVVSGTATKFAQLKRTIDELDRRQRQVLIECSVVELATSAVQRLGIELGFLDLKEGGQYTRGFGFTSFGLSEFSDTDDDGLPDTRLPNFENPLQGVTGGIIRGDGFAIPVLINALAQDNQANVLSQPSVVVTNNGSALVKTEENRPTQTVQQNQTGSQSGAGADKDAGIELRISPSISTNNYLRMQIELEVSRFISEFDPDAVTAGVRTIRQIQTNVAMPTGHTMVLGGVIEDQESSTESGIPFLKDIPLLGYLFKNSEKRQTKTNLYIFVTPHILNEEDFSDLAELTFRKKLEAADYIGHRRLQLVDRKWREGRAETLDDPGATIEDIDARGGFEIPVYQREERAPVDNGTTQPIRTDTGGGTTGGGTTDPSRRRPGPGGPRSPGNGTR